MEPVTGQSWQRVRRPLTRLTAAATAAHVFFELFAGVGMRWPRCWARLPPPPRCGRGPHNLVKIAALAA
jgi:hypothetical protein